MITTPQLIDLLAASAKPVKRLRPPLLRTLFWLLLAALVFGLLAVGHGVRQDFAQRIAQPVFVVGLVASLATGALAAVAAFFLSLPDRSRCVGPASRSRTGGLGVDSELRLPDALG